MKTLPKANAPGHAQGIVHGHIGRGRAAGTITVSDNSTSVATSELVFDGAHVAEFSDGTTHVTIEGTGDNLTNGAGADLNIGDVVVLDATTGEVTTTTTAQDTRPVGVVQVAAFAGDSASVLFTGFVDQVNTTGTVNAGDYLETSATAGKAQSSGTTRRTGTFGIAITAGPDPSALLGLNADTGSGTNDFVLKYDGGVENVKEHGNAGSTETISLADGNYHRATLNANCTFTFSGATSAKLCRFGLELTQDGTGGWTVTWPGSVVWPGGSAPTFDTTAGATTVLTFWSTDAGSSWFGTAGASSLTVKDEGVALASPATALDFVGSGVTASGTGATKTITISGAPAGAAGGDLSGTYPNPSVVDDSHNHTATTLPSNVIAGHVHVAYETHTADGSTTTFTLDQFYEAGSVMAWNRTTGYVLGVTEVLPDQATISAAGTAADLIDFHYAASVI